MKVLCVHSFAVHGTASMKAILSILGTRVLPVPSLYLSGLSNIEGYVRTSVSFEELFTSSLDIARSRKEKILMYIGYLGAPEQVELILKGIEKYGDIITQVLVDPVSGDHGRLYVPDSILEAWPLLLERADWAFPNYTELQWLSGRKLGQEIHAEQYIEAFRKRFPHLNMVLTSLPSEQALKLGIFEQEKVSYFSHEKVEANFGGTGDVFLSYYILNAYFHKREAKEAAKLAALQTLDVIKSSVEAKSPDLLIFPVS